VRIRIAYATVYTYEQPPRSVVQRLKLTPRSFEGQHIAHWRVDVEPDARLLKAEDPLGNISHTLYCTRPGGSLTLTVHGEAETMDTNGVVRGSVERFPTTVFLRQTALTQPDEALAQFADDVAAAAGRDALTRLHELMAAVHRRLRFETGRTDTDTTAAQAFAAGHGVCQDLSHIFIAGARRMGIPARYVSGHLARAESRLEDAAHAWAEAYVEHLGWVGFDAANGVCPGEAHLRVAVGMDYLDAAPVRGSRYGGGAETLEVRLRADQGVSQRQD
jgi:transglutaminase-like putative cysteine protease